MKQFIVYTILTTQLVLVSVISGIAQCSICTKTASQLGEGPAKALNGAIVYLMMMPFAIIGFIAFRWFKNERRQG